MFNSLWLLKNVFIGFKQTVKFQFDHVFGLKPTSNSCLGTSQISFKAPLMAKIFQFLFMAKLVLVGIVNNGCLVLLFLLYCAEVCNVLGGPITISKSLRPAAYLVSKKCRSNGKSLATLCPI